MSTANAGAGASLCLIGNSHVAAIQQAWARRPPPALSGISIDYFAAWTRLLHHLKLDGTVLRCGQESLRDNLLRTSGGQDSIDLSRYDAFVVIGCGFGFDIQKVSENGDLSSSAREPERTLLSRSCFAAIIETELENSLAVKLIDMIRSASDKPVLLCAEPYLSERALTEEEAFQGQNRFHDQEFLGSLASAAEITGAKISGRHGFTLLWQEKETVGAPGFTKAEYGLNPIWFTKANMPSRAFDSRHGNEEYGYVMLCAILRRLHEMLGGRVLAEEPEWQSRPA